MPIIDSHIHIYSLDKDTYPRKAAPAAEPPPEPSEAKDYLRDAKASAVDKAIFVIPTFYGTDTAYADYVAQKHPERFRIVIFTDFSSDAGRDILKQQIVENWIRGARLHLHTDPRDNGELKAASDIQQAIRTIADYRKVVDLHIKQEQMEVVCAFASDFQDTAFVIDHMGRPDPVNVISDTYKRRIEQLASFPNIYVKLSGYELESKTGYPFDDMTIYAGYLLETLGVDRCMWGSDYPYIKNNENDLASTLGLAKTLVKGKRKKDAERFLSGTAHELFWAADKK